MMTPGKSKPSVDDARAIVAIASRQFGARFASWLGEHVDELQVEHSRKTGKLRYVHAGGSLLLVLRPVDGFFSLALEAARVLATLEKDHRENGITILDEVSDVVKTGGNVFVKHVVAAPPTLRPSQEVYVIDQQGTVLSVGKCLLSGRDMAKFKRGIAVKTRHGAADKE